MPSAEPVSTAGLGSTNVAEARNGGVRIVYSLVNRKTVTTGRSEENQAMHGPNGHHACQG